MLSTPGQCCHGNGTAFLGRWEGAHWTCFTARLPAPHQNWAGMRCPYKLLRMVLALVCSE